MKLPGLKSLLALVLSSSLGCAALEGEIVSGREYRIAVDDAFSEPERAELAAAVERWRVASDGRMNVVLVRSSDDADGRIHRRSSDLAYRRRTLEVWVDPDELGGDLGPEPLRRTVMHLEGRLFGLPTVSGARAILNPEDIGEELTEADLEACRSVDLCGGSP